MCDVKAELEGGRESRFGERTQEDACCWWLEGSRGVAGYATCGAGCLIAHNGNLLIDRNGQEFLKVPGG